MDIKRENGNDVQDTSTPMVFSTVTGSLYVLLGLLQLSAGAIRILIGPDVQVPLTNLLFIPADIIGAFVLLLIGTVFIYGVIEMHSGIFEGISYAYVGILISLIFAAIYMLVSTGNMLEAYLLKNEDFIGWTPASDLRPGIYLAILPLFAFIKWKNMFEPINESRL
ncbi:hypothetical protein [Methanolobus psychrotolerans]|uniref:hypothetical protein n=1 Tax=Methanolobus psychrotolerans TaxID=1874706 RepID=UPI000B91816F|nr:hypothetical protein [Methanolobus psychrotolerans]